MMMVDHISFNEIKPLQSIEEAYHVGVPGSQAIMT
jgi:hypothetical protein